MSADSEQPSTEQEVQGAYALNLFNAESRIFQAFSTANIYHIESNLLIEITVKNVATKQESLLKVRKNKKFQFILSLTIYQVVKTDTVYDIQTWFAEQPSSSQETCFNLLKNDKVLEPFELVGEIEGIEEDPTLDLVYSAYTEVEAKAHLTRIREILGFSNDSSVDGTKSYSVLNAGETNFYSIEDLDVPADEQVAKLESNPLTYEQLSTPFSFEKLVANSLPASKRAVRSVNLSHWNPPPANYQMKGHLFYLQVATNEGKTFHITASTAGFYVNNTSGEKFDTTPKRFGSKYIQSHSLLTVLKELSPSVEEIIVANATALKDIEPHAFIDPSSTFLASPWIVDPTVKYPDLSKTQNLSSTVETNKDWIEEIQSTKELEKSNFHERLVRERVLNKTYFDFTQAAVKGAINIAKGNVTALNALEPKENHIYLSNGIFYSLGTDATGVHENNGGDNAARYATSKEPIGVNLLNGFDIDGLNPLATSAIDYCGRRFLAQIPVPGIFRSNVDNESQIVYGCVEEEGKINADEDFAKLIEVLAKSTHSKPRKVFDAEGNAVELLISYRCNGLLGSDNRKYLLDFHKLTPIDLGFYDDLKGDEEYPHKIGSLRFEAVEEWWRAKARADIQAKLDAKRAEIEKNAPPKKEEEEEKKDEQTEGNDEESKEEKPEEPEVTLTKEEEEAIVDYASEHYRVNTDVPLDLSTIPDEKARAEYAKDAEVVREISNQVKNVYIPKLLEDLKSGVQNVPYDGTQLTSSLHIRGINMRYLGYIAELAEKEGSVLKVFRNLVIQEIVARSVKHILSKILVSLPLDFVPYAVSHFLNCLLGSNVNEKPEAVVDPLLSSLYPHADTSVFSSLTVESVQTDVIKVAASRFRFPIEKDWFKTVSALPLFREISIKNGLQWKNIKYDFVNGTAASVSSSASESTKKSKKSKKNSNSSPKEISASTVFTPDDLLNVVPIIKSSNLKSSIAEELLESGRYSIIRGENETGIQFLNESLSIFESIYGAVHPDTARVLSQLALVHKQLNNTELAVEYGRKAVIVQERCSGVDSAEAIFLYLNLALMEHNNNNTYGALQLISHAYKFWSTICSPEHPDSITTMNNIGAMLQNLKLYEQSLHWYKASLDLSIKTYGEDSLNVGALYYQISQAQVVLGDYEGAVESMSKSHKIYESNFGEDNILTKETKSWLDQIQKIVEVSAKNAQQAGSAESAAAAAALAAANKKAAGYRHHAAFSNSTVNTSNDGLSAKAKKIQAELGTKSINEILDYVNGTGKSLKKSKKAKKSKGKN